MYRIGLSVKLFSMVQLTSESQSPPHTYGTYVPGGKQNVVTSLCGSGIWGSGPEKLYGPTCSKVFSPHPSPKESIIVIL